MNNKIKLLQGEKDASLSKIEWEQVMKEYVDKNVELKRQHWRYEFAGRAMQGELASQAAGVGVFPADSEGAKLLVSRSLCFADALLAELEKKS